jgi:DNA topoisomerase I
MEHTNTSTMQSLTSAAAAGLVYVSDATPGIRRIRRRDGFEYVMPEGRRLTDRGELDRIAKLVIPPAYRDVWICPDPRGHLQATGRDARGRKQYRYHPSWRMVRDAQKFDRMPAFAEALPLLRRRLRRDLALRGMPRDKVLAIAVSLLDATRVRIGNAEYVRQNDSYGLTTLKNRHAEFVRDGRLVLRFAGKGGAAHEICVGDRRLARLVRHCHELPGQRLFQYVDDAGETRPIDSDQVNAYLKECMGDDFTAKDFRTWNATLRAMQIMHATPLPNNASERALAACIVQAVKQVAVGLRNTPAVCRKSYINPVVFDAWRSGALHDAIREDIRGAPRKAERVAAAFLRSHALVAAHARRHKGGAMNAARQLPLSPAPRRLQPTGQRSLRRLEAPTI